MAKRSSNCNGNGNGTSNAACKLCLDPVFHEPDKFVTADYQIQVQDLCPGSRVAIVSEVRRRSNGQTLATMHDIFDVPRTNCTRGNCNCATVTRTYRDVVLDLSPAEDDDDDPCDNLDESDLQVVVVRSNYISRNDSQCDFDEDDED